MLTDHKVTFYRNSKFDMEACSCSSEICFFATLRLWGQAWSNRFYVSFIIRALQYLSSRSCLTKLHLKFVSQCKALTWNVAEGENDRFSFKRKWRSAGGSMLMCMLYSKRKFGWPLSKSCHTIVLHTRIIIIPKPWHHYNQTKVLYVCHKFICADLHVGVYVAHKC